MWVKWAGYSDALAFVIMYCIRQLRSGNHDYIVWVSNALMFPTNNNRNIAAGIFYLFSSYH